MSEVFAMNGEGVGHNSDVQRLIKETAEEVIRLKAKKAEIQEQITEVKSGIKGKGIKMAEFNAALRLFELEAEDQAESLEKLQLCFAALGLGDQGELFAARAAE